MYRALIVDDEKIIADGIKSLLPWEELGFSEVHAECDPERALRLALQDTPDLIVTDIRMPKLDGVKLLGEIRGKGIDSMAIVLSGHNDFEYVRAMALLGIEDYLLKPVNEEKLMQVTQRVFDKLELRVQKRLHMQMADRVFRDNIIKRWVHGTIDEAELSEKATLCQLRCDAECFLPCLMTIDPGQRGPLAKYEIARALAGQLTNSIPCVCAHGDGGDLIVVAYGGKELVSPLREQAVLAARSFDAEIRVLCGQSVSECMDVSRSYHLAVGENEQRAPLFPCEPSPLSQRLQDYVQKHYAEDLSLKLIAQAFKGNAAYIGQIFKRDTNMMFSEFLQSVRLRKARELLETTTLNAREVALRVGFQNETYFFTVFRKKLGISPADYKRRATQGQIADDQ